MSTTALPKYCRWHPSGTGVQIRYPGFRSTTVTPTEVITTLAELERRAADGNFTLPTKKALRGTTLREAAADHLHRLETVGGKQGRAYKQSGLKAARRDHRPWLGTQVVDDPKPVGPGGVPFADMRLAALPVDAIDLYLEARAAKAPRAAVNEAQSFRNTLLLAQRRGEQFDPRLLTLVVKRQKPAKRRPLTWDELHVLASWTQEYIRRLWLLGGTLGCRISELLQADETWLDLNAKPRATFTVPWWARKGNHAEGDDLVIHLLAEEVVLFREQLVARGRPSTLLFPRLQGGDWRHNHFWEDVVAPSRRKAAAAYRDQHGLADGAWTPYEWPLLSREGRPVLDDDGQPVIRGFQPHDLRRGTATVLKQVGVPSNVVAARLGHADDGWLVDTTYATTPDEAVLAHLDAIDRAGGIGARLKAVGGTS